MAWKPHLVLAWMAGGSAPESRVRLRDAEVAQALQTASSIKDWTTSTVHAFVEQRCHAKRGQAEIWSSMQAGSDTIPVRETWHGV